MHNFIFSNLLTWAWAKSMHVKSRKKVNKFAKYYNLLVRPCNTWEQSERREIFSTGRVKHRWFERLSVRTIVSVTL